MSIKDNIERINGELGDRAKLIAVSKYHTNEQIMEAYNAGQRAFGENRVQELEAKQPQLPEDIEWHLIGTLQRNKVKYVVPYVAMIHSVDSIRLLREIEKQCKRLGRETLPVLLQIHISGEESKHGFSQEELDDLAQSGLLAELEHTQVVGLMGMASLTEDRSIVEREFERMQELLQELQSTLFADDPDFRELSIGMSQDYKIALKYGATFVRIGSAVFS